jgi:F-box domain.
MLPYELFLMVTEYLNLVDLVRLRRTCKQLRYAIPVDYIRKELSRLPVEHIDKLMSSHCVMCMRTFGSTEHRKLLVRKSFDPKRSRLHICIDCAVTHEYPRLHVRVGRRIKPSFMHDPWRHYLCGDFIEDRRNLGSMPRAHSQADDFHRIYYDMFRVGASLLILLRLAQPWLEWDLAFSLPKKLKIGYSLVLVSLFPTYRLEKLINQRYKCIYWWLAGAIRLAACRHRNT